MSIGDKFRNLIHFPLGKFLMMVSVAYTTSMFATPADATIYYISPTGADSNSGTSSSSPWKTFGFAIRKLRAGDTLILRNGTYNASNTGYVNVNCSTNAANGVSGQPITIKAENERQAFIDGDGSVVPFNMSIILGIRMFGG